MTGKIVPDIVENQTLYTLPPDGNCRDAAKMMKANKNPESIPGAISGSSTSRNASARLA